MKTTAARIGLVWLCAGVTGCATDPAPGFWWTKRETRNLECVHQSQQLASEQHPGFIDPPAARNVPGITDALVCSTRFVTVDERPARDELILSTLSQSVGQIVGVAAALVPAQATWHVDAFYPDAAVASKIAVAARTDLAERGRKVSDRVPVLAAGDIAVLAHLGPREAYPLACNRYFAEHVLTEPQVFLGLMILDEREGQLHAGLCTHGDWKWLQ